MSNENDYKELTNYIKQTKSVFMIQLLKIVVLLCFAMNCSTQNVYKFSESDEKKVIGKFYSYPFDTDYSTAREFKQAIYRIQNANADLSKYLPELKSLLFNFGNEDHLKSILTPFFNYLDSIEVVKFIEHKYTRREMASRYIRDTIDSNQITDIISNDSLFTEFLNVHSKIKINNNIIYLAGMLEDDELIDILQDSSRTKYFDVHAVELALARRGVEPHYKNVINLNKINLENESKIPFYSDSLTMEYSYKESTLFYLNSQESIFECTKLLRTNLLKQPPSHGATGNYYAREFTLAAYLSIGDYDLDELVERMDYFHEMDIDEAVEYFETNLFDLIQPNLNFPHYRPRKSINKKYRKFRH